MPSGITREGFPACITLLTGTSCAQILLAPSDRRSALGEIGKRGQIRPPPVTRTRREGRRRSDGQRVRHGARREHQPQVRRHHNNKELVVLAQREARNRREHRLGAPTSRIMTPSGDSIGTPRMIALSTSCIGGGFDATLRWLLGAKSCVP